MNVLDATEQRSSLAASRCPVWWVTNVALPVSSSAQRYFIIVTGKQYKSRWYSIQQVSTCYRLSSGLLYNVTRFLVLCVVLIWSLLAMWWAYCTYFVACSIRVFLRIVFLTSYEYCIKKSFLVTKLPYFLAHKTHRDSFVRNFRKK